MTEVTTNDATPPRPRYGPNVPRVLRMTGFACQVCVPKGWTDEQIIELAEREYPCGTQGGWFVRKEGDRLLRGAAERAICENDPDWVHVILDA